MRARIWLGFALLGMAGAAAADSAMLKLPPPETTGGMPLMQALQVRRSTREFADRPLPAQLLSNLLWAAGGINRPETGKRTAPSARDWREIDIYVVLADGAYVYDPKTHELRPVVARDLRAQTGTQDFVAGAPLNLVYVADQHRMPDATPEDRNRNTALMAAYRATPACSAPRPASPPSCAARWTAPRSRRPSASARTSRSSSRRRSGIQSKQREC
jgi:hypothetical protein